MEEEPIQSVAVQLHSQFILLNALSQFLVLLNYLLSGKTPINHLVSF